MNFLNQKFHTEETNLGGNVTLKGAPKAFGVVVKDSLSADRQAFGL